MALAAYLCLEGHPFLRLEKVGNGLAQAVFDDGDEVGSLVEDYNAGLAAVEPRTFVAKLTFVRTKLRDAAK